MTRRGSQTSWTSQGSEGPHGTGPQRCTAKAKSTGERCGNWPIRGATVCGVHGGRAKQVRAAAQRRLAAEKVESDVKNALAFESLEGVTDPLGALSRLADEALAMKEALAARVNDLNRIRYSAHGSGTEQLRAEVALYERAMDRSAKFLALLVDSGFEERRTRLAEQEGALVAGVIQAILREMLGVVRSALTEQGVGDQVVLEAVDRAWGEAVPVVAPRELRALSEPGKRP